MGGELKCYRHTDPPTKRVLEEHSLLKMSDVLCAYNTLFLEKYRPEVGLLSDPASSRAAPWPPSNRIIRCSRDTGAEVSCSNQSQGSSL